MEINPFEVIQRSDRARARFRQRQRRAVDLLDIGPFLERTLLSLSNGERQRVHGPREICHPLRLVILDEPFTGLDAVTRAHFNELLARLMRLLFAFSSSPPPVRGDSRRDYTRARSKPVRGCFRTGTRGHDDVARGVGDSKLQVPYSDPKPMVDDRETLRRALVVLRNVTVRYGEKTILKGVGLDDPRGAELGVAGAEWFAAKARCSVSFWEIILRLMATRWWCLTANAATASPSGRLSDISVGSHPNFTSTSTERAHVWR